MPASQSEPGEELAVDPRTLPRDSLSHQLLTPPDGGQLLPEKKKKGDRDREGEAWFKKKRECERTGRQKNKQTGNSQRGSSEDSSRPGSC